VDLKRRRVALTMRLDDDPARSRDGAGSATRQDERSSRSQGGARQAANGRRPRERADEERGAAGRQGAMADALARALAKR
jgi:uncharacterized protein